MTDEIFRFIGIRPPEFENTPANRIDYVGSKAYTEIVAIVEDEPPDAWPKKIAERAESRRSREVRARNQDLRNLLLSLYSTVTRSLGGADGDTTPEPRESIQSTIAEHFTETSIDRVLAAVESSGLDFECIDTINETFIANALTGATAVELESNHLLATIAMLHAACSGRLNERETKRLLSQRYYPTADLGRRVRSRLELRRLVTKRQASRADAQQSDQRPAAETTARRRSPIQERYRSFNDIRRVRDELFRGLLENAPRPDEPAPRPEPPKSSSVLSETLRLVSRRLPPGLDAVIQRQLLEREAANFELADSQREAQNQERWANTLAAASTKLSSAGLEGSLVLPKSQSTSALQYAYMSTFWKVNALLCRDPSISPEPEDTPPPELVEWTPEVLEHDWGFSAVGLDVYGFMDLYRAEERLVGFSARELAHIENQIAKELRERSHLHYRSTEETLTLELEEQREETRDLQTSSRSELKEESERTLQEEFSVDADLSVSISYGALAFSVGIDANASIHYGRSTEESKRSASTFARETVSKSISRIKTKNRSVQTVREIVRVEERNLHRLEPKDEDHSAVYLWVDREEEISLKNYGKRLLLEFTIPEPGAYIRSSYRKSSSLAPPQKFTRLASELDEVNYLYYQHQYGAKVDPPPEEFITVAASHIEESEPVASEDDPNYIDDAIIELKLKIPEGYVPKILECSATIASTAVDSTRYPRAAIMKRQIFIALAGVKIVSGGLTSTGYSTGIVSLDAFPFTVDPNSEGLPLMIRWSNTNASKVGANAYIVCQRSCQRFRRWQLETHDAIMAGYATQLARYEDALADERERSIPTVGSTPDTNRVTERQELKRLALAQLSESPVDYGAVYENNGVPETDIKALKKFEETMKFFEGSFEWKQSLWFLYPYYWARRESWRGADEFVVADPKHGRFLRAGAARFLVPVKPGQERSVLNYLIDRFVTGLVPLGADLVEYYFPDIATELPTDSSESTSDELWVDSVLDSREDLVLGQGRLTVQTALAEVTLNSPGLWPLNLAVDINREIWIQGKPYSVASIDAPDKITLDRPFEGPNRNDARFLIAPELVAPPWKVRQATQLVILAGQEPKLPRPG